MAVANPIAPAAPVTTATCPASGSSLRRAEFRLLQRPVFDVEQIRFRQRLKATDRFGVGDCGNSRFGKVGGDLRILLASAKSEYSDAGHQHHPRQRIEHLLDAADARVVAHEIAFVLLAIFCDCLTHRAPKPDQVRLLGRGNHQRPVLDSDVVVGRNDAGLPVSRRLRRR